MADTRSININEEQVTCGITSEIYLKPVTLQPSGKTVEEDVAIDLMRTTRLCPYTRQTITDYFENEVALTLTEVYLLLHPEKISLRHQRNVTVTQPTAPRAPESAAARPISTAQTTARQVPDIAMARGVRVVPYRVPVEVAPTAQRTVESAAARRPITSEAAVASRNSTEMTNALLEEIDILLMALDFIKRREYTQRPVVLSLFLPDVSPPAWTKVKVSAGPKNETMHFVLSAASHALITNDPTPLEEAKRFHAKEYDKVTTLLNGTLSISDHYGQLASLLGTVRNQPGWHVVTMVEKVEAFLKLHPARTIERSPEIGIGPRP